MSHGTTLPTGAINGGYIMRLEVNGYPPVREITHDIWESSEVFEDLTIFGVIDRQSYALTPNRQWVGKSPKRSRF